jgi:copper chaperone CopZ
MNDVTLNVPTVHCRSCKLNIEETLEELDGVTASDVDLDAKTVTVNFDPAVVSAEVIASTVTDAGYPASAN